MPELLGQGSGGNSPGWKGRHSDFFLGAHRPRQAQNRHGHCQEALNADALEDTDPQGRVLVQSASAAPDQDYQQHADDQTALQGQNFTTQGLDPPCSHQAHCCCRCVTQDDSRTTWQRLEPLARVHRGPELAGQERLHAPQPPAGQLVPPMPPGPSSGTPGLRQPRSRRRGAA